MSNEPPNILDQHWLPHLDPDGSVVLVGQDGTEIVRLMRPDRGSNLFVAGYIVALQAAHLETKGKR